MVKIKKILGYVASIFVIGVMVSVLAPGFAFLYLLLMEYFTSSGSGFDIKPNTSSITKSDGTFYNIDLYNLNDSTFTIITTNQGTDGTDCLDLTNVPDNYCIKADTSDIDIEDRCVLRPNCKYILTNNAHDCGSFAYEIETDRKCRIITWSTCRPFP